MLAAGIGLLVRGSTVRAQDEQWLQYKCEREAERIVGFGDMRTSSLEVSPIKPPDVKLPQFKAVGVDLPPAKTDGRMLPWLILTDREHIVRAEGFALTELQKQIGK